MTYYTILYGLECWGSWQEDLSVLEATQMKFLVLKQDVYDRIHGVTITYGQAWL